MRGLLVIFFVVATGRAHGEPHDIVSDSLVLARGELATRLTTEINLGHAPDGEAVTPGRPLSFAIGAAVGVTDRLTLGVIQGNRAQSLIEVGAGICVRGCDDTFVDAGVEATYLALPGSLAIAPRARLLIRDFDPAKPATTLGALARWQRGRFAITSDPYLRLGLANRDRGNRAALVVPVWLAVQPTCRWLIALHVGYDADLAVAREGWHGPFGLVGVVRPTARVELGLELGFRSLLGPQNQIRERAALLTAAYRSRLF